MTRFIVLAVLLAAACGSPRGWTRPGGDQTDLARDRSECWSVAYVEARRRFAAERAWLRPALLRIRIEDGQDIRIDDGFVALGLHLDEVGWRSEALQTCMLARDYARAEQVRERLPGSQVVWRGPVVDGIPPSPAGQKDAGEHERAGDEVISVQYLAE